MAYVDDEMLFERLLEGEGDALRPLMERYGNSLTLYANGYVHDLDTAEDLMIEAYSRIIIKRPRLRKGGFRPYLFKVTRNLALRHIHLSRRFMNLDDMQSEPPSAQQVEAELLHEERRQELYHCLAKIPSDYREALYLVYLEGMSYDEAGAIMRKTRKQIDNLVQRGKRSMRALLDEKDMLDDVV